MIESRGVRWVRCVACMDMRNTYNFSQRSSKKGTTKESRNKWVNDIKYTIQKYCDGVDWVNQGVGVVWFHKVREYLDQQEHFDLSEEQPVSWKYLTVLRNKL
jgi:hypothetical protein